MNRSRRRRKRKRLAKKNEVISKEQISQIDKQDTGRPNREMPPEKTLRTSMRWLWGGLLAAIAIVGFAYQFRPEINVDRDISLDVRDPFATQFRVTNEGLLALYDLSFSCEVENAMMHNFTVGGFKGQESLPVLESKESTTKSCSIKAESFPFLSTLFFQVRYRPKWCWRSSTKRTKFVNMRDSQGNLDWVKQPTDSN